MSFYEVKISYTMNTEKGGQKTITETYIVKAVSVTDAEVRATEAYSSQLNDFRVKSATEKKIKDVLVD